MLVLGRQSNARASPAPCRHTPCLIAAAAAAAAACRRHCAAPLVCRRWRDLVHSPQLLRSLDISLTSTQALPAFCAWLAGRAAAHVECLHLDLQAEASFADTHLLLGSLQVRWP